MLKRHLYAILFLVIGQQSLAIDLKLPWPSGETWQVTVGYNGYCTASGCPDEYHTDANNGYYALDFDDPLAAPGSGRPILAAAAGNVIFAGGDPNTSFGYYVKIDHGGGYITLYGHLKEYPTVSGYVTQGTQIGKLGSTGWSTGDHLHFALYYNGNCLSLEPNSKPEPFSGYTNIAFGQPLVSNNSGAIYSCAYVSQDPAGAGNEMTQGQTATFEVKFKNTGNTVWRNDPIAYPNDYVELKSCDVGGTVMGSFLYYSNWKNTVTPCTMQETSVAPGETATFVLTGQVATDAPLGLKLVYFRVNHSVGGLMSDWGGMHFQVYVVPSYTPDPKADIAVLYNYGTNPCQTRAHMLLSDGDSLQYQGDAGWKILNDFCLPLVKFSVQGDFNGDGLSDIVMVYQYAECEMALHCLLSNGSSFDYAPYWWSTGGYCLYAVRGVDAGDFNGDGKDDLAFVYNYGGCQTRIHVMLSTGSGFAYQGNEGWWIGNGWYCAENVKFVKSGHFDGDNKDDLVLAYRYGQATTALHVFLSTGSAFVYQGNNWFYADGWFSLDAMKFMETGDITGDGLDDVVMACRYGPDETALLGFVSQGNTFWYQGWWWHSIAFSLDNTPYMQVDDITGDGKADVALAYRYGEYSSAVHACISSGSAFSFAPYYWQAEGYGWDYTNTFAIGVYNPTGGSPKMIADSPSDNGPPATSFILNDNYPNPFNPVTVISYSLPEATNVKLDVFNILGQKVTTLVNGNQEAGEHTITWDASSVASGVYFYRIQTANAFETKKMLLLK